MLKDWDLPLYVEYGVADFGIAGADVLAEMDGDLLVPARLRDGACRARPTEPSRGQGLPVGVVVVVQGQADLLQVVLALACGRRPRAPSARRAGAGR